MNRQIIEEIDQWMQGVRCGHTSTFTLLAACRTALAAAEWNAEQLVDAQSKGHGDGQRDALADVNAGRVDDLIMPRLSPLLKDLDNRVNEILKLREELEWALFYVNITLDAEHAKRRPTSRETCVSADCERYRKAKAMIP